MTLRLWLKHKIRELFGIDLRTLAVFRIGLAFLTLIDLFFRSFDLTAHYTDLGIMPRDVLIDHFLRPYEWSLFLISGSTWVQALLFVCFAFLLVLMLVGYRTAYVVPLCWAFLHSLHVRNSYILNGGDYLLRMLFVWAMFLPLGKRYSLDARLRPAATGQEPMHFSVGSIALLLQVGLMYFCTIVFRSESKSWHDGSALFYSLSQPNYSTQVGIWLLHFPGLLKKLTFISFYLEMLGPFLLFLPFFTPWVRILIVALFSFFHMGILIAMWAGMFPLISIWAMTPYLPGFLWNKLKKFFGFIPVVMDWFAPRGTVPPTDARAFHPKFIFLAKICRRGLVAFLFIVGIATNLKSINVIHKENWPQIDHVARFFGIKQSWQMYPDPNGDIWWCVLQGRKFNGDIVNLSDPSRPVDFQNPPRGYKVFKNWRWRRFIMWRDFSRAKDLTAFADFVCRDWNQDIGERSERLQDVTVYMVGRKLRDDSSVEAIRKSIKYKQYCFRGFMDKINQYVDGKAVGPHKEYYSNGQLERSGSYAAGLRVGNWAFWYRNGNLYQQVKYINGKKEGTQVTWNRDGRSQRDCFASGVKVACAAAFSK